MAMPGNDNSIKKFRRSQIALYHPTIGEGAYGKVYKAILDDILLVAVKELKPTIVGTFRNSGDRELEAAQNEISMLSKLRHPNVVTLIGTAGDFGHNQVPWMVFEYMPDGCVTKFLITNALPESQLIKFCYDICEGMKFLHSKGVCHRDLAGRNVLLDVDRNLAKVADLGMSVFARRNPVKRYCVMSHEVDPMGIPVYHNPKECFTDKVFSSASDVWSFGVTMCEMFNGGLHPYKGMTLMNALEFIMKGNTPLSRINLDCSLAILDIIKQTLVIDRKLRPSFDDLSKQFDIMRKRPFSKISAAGMDREEDASVCGYSGRVYNRRDKGNQRGANKYSSSKSKNRKKPGCCQRMMQPFIDFIDGIFGT